MVRDTGMKPKITQKETRRRGCSPKKGVAEAERAWCPTEGGTSEAEHRIAIFTPGKSTVYFRGEYPRQIRVRFYGKQVVK